MQAVIELGEDRSTEARRAAPARYQKGWVALTALAAALALGGSAIPALAFAPVRAVHYRNAEMFQLSDDAAYVVDRSTARSAHIGAYLLAGGQARWNAVLSERVANLVLADPAGVLLVEAVATGGVAVAGGAVQGAVAPVTALDLATGLVRWRVPATTRVDVAPDRGTAVLWVPDEAGRTEARGIDLRTGDTRWSRLVSPDALLSSEALRPDAVPVLVVSGTSSSGAWLQVVRLPDGSTQVLDGRTGALTASGRLYAPPVDSPGNPGTPALAAIGDLVVVRYRDLYATVLDGYDLGTLRQRWRLRLPGYDPYLDGCGRLLCVGGQDGVHALAPASGLPRWVVSTRNRAAALPGDPAGRLLAFDSPAVSGLAPRRGQILDAATGAVLVDLGAWWPLDDRPAGGTLLLGRLDDTGWNSSFVLLDIGHRARQWRGMLPVSFRDCQATAGYLVCPTANEQLQIWRYRR